MSKATFIVGARYALFDPDGRPCNGRWHSHTRIGSCGSIVTAEGYSIRHVAGPILALDTGEAWCEACGELSRRFMRRDARYRWGVRHRCASSDLKGKKI